MKDEFRYPAMLHGTVLHKIIEIIHKSYWNFDVPNNYRHLMNETEYQGRDYQIPVKWEDRDKEISDYTDNAHEIIANYRNKTYNQNCTAILSEAPFRVKIGGIMYEGVIDQVRQLESGEKVLVDFKSGKMKPDAVAVTNDIQFPIYLIALAEGEFNINGIWARPRLFIDRCALYFLRGHEVYKRNGSYGKIGDEKDSEPLIWVSRSSADIELFKQELSQIHKAMNQQLFYRNANGCRFCHHKEACDSSMFDVSHDELDRAQELMDAFNPTLKEVA